MNISPQAWDAFVKGVQGGANPAALARVMVKAFNPDQPRDEHGRWSASVVTEINPENGSPNILSVHTDPAKAEDARIERDENHWDAKEYQYAEAHQVDVVGPKGDRVSVVASAHPGDEDASVVHGAFTDPSAAQKMAEQMSRDSWGREGQQRDYEDVWRAEEKAGKSNSWDDAAEAWNAGHPDQQIGDRYTFGTYPEFERQYEAAHGIGEIMPYPGLKAANDYFSDGSPQHVFRVSTRRVKA